MPAGKRANVKNEKQYEALKDKGMSRNAAKIANSPGASTAGREIRLLVQLAEQLVARRNDCAEEGAGRKGGKATARKS